MPFAKTIFDEVLGELEFEAEQDGYLGLVTHEGLDVSLFLFATEDFPDVTSRLATAKRVCLQLDRIDVVAIASRLVELYEQRWRDDREQLDATTMASRFTLESIHIDGEDGVALSFSDDDIFLGHSIDAQFDSTMTLTDVDLSG
jgi:hypothetical protein